ncbi:hypothetical protein SKAU_G00216220 [Synaphobranchus kaupii]|uniref:Uncharacterized protein n=1 Tax=Synaphobranchus kaupii TaxID=118154 RepID=A0A9Q1FA01_SYNKA|nr:hypothetical protein SKAU_G00216220 [Synaphobranchus kaupii]
MVLLLFTHLRYYELVNLATYCERIRRRFWPEWHTDCDELCSGDVSEDSGASSEPLEFGLFSGTETFEEEVTESSSLSCSLVADTDCSAATPFDSDTDMDASGHEQDEV